MLGPLFLFFISMISQPALVLTRRVKSFPWDALVYGSIMASYLNLEKLGKPKRCVMLWASMSRLPVWVGLIHTYIRLLTTSPKGLFSANYKEKDKNKNIYKLFKVTIANH